ncbi:MAG: methyltransferase domain-containing protein [Filimonas sp.]|nr:methyltransferase domain-containing protein [Filimonas sp.]
MNEHIALREFNYNGQSLLLYVPEEKYVQQAYYKEKQENPKADFPYWAKLWPSALALADFIAHNTDYVKNKRVVELAAGLGLPSFVAAPYALSVYASDYLEEAVDVMEMSRIKNDYSNVQCSLLNWHHLPENLSADILLMSDVNYDPVEFEQLLKVFERFLSKGTTIILATPQRLMAKPFVERLLKYVVEQEQKVINGTGISIFVLRLFQIGNQHIV